MPNDIRPDPKPTTRHDDSLGRLRALFDALVELPEQQRAAWLDAQVSAPADRAALLRLLAAHDGRGFLDTPMDQHAARLAADELAPASLVGQTIGQFRVVRALGQGGMAAVFLGAREGADFEQQVAIKLLRRGLYSELEQRLFMRERQVLAGLNHPNIAHLIDGGVTAAGIPYLVMEYIDGQPITRYAEQQRLDARRRLELFLGVCRAVEAAHRSLVVHRDIKPSNILVTADGEAKLLDFGIAKLLEEDSDGATVGVYTPDYAAPEQISGGAITTATDVYGLGVLLHELLLGMRPEGVPTRRPSSRVTEIAAHTQPGAVLPFAPAQLRKLLRGDLDNILLKALDPEPERRYASAGAFADDIERLLGRRPVKAHPPSRLYRTRKFIQRHRGGVAVTATFLLAILASLGLALWQAQVARREATRANAMRDFMITAFVEAEPSVPREGPPRITEVVEKAIASARSNAHMNPGVRAELLTELGAVLRVQGRLAPALETSRWNYDQTVRDFGEAAPLSIAAGHELVKTLFLTSDYGQARSLADQLIARVPANDVAMHAKVLLASAELATKQHERARALEEGGRGLELTRTLGDDDALAEALSDFGNVQLTVDDVRGATSTYEELLKLREKELGPEHVVVGAAHADLSRAYRRQRRLADAEREIRAALAIDAKVLPKDDWRHANHLNALTMVLWQEGDFRGALEAAVDSLRIDRIAYPDDHAEVATELNNVGMLDARLEDFAAAVTPLRESLTKSEAKFGAEHFETAVTRANYGVALASAGSEAAGEAEVRHAIASLEASAEPDLDEIAATYEKLVRLKLAANDTRTALPLIDRMEGWLAKIKDPDEYWKGRMPELRARALLQTDQPAAAQPLVAQASAALATSKAADPVLSTEVSLVQAQIAVALKDANAQTLTAQARASLAALHNPPTRLVHMAEALPHTDAAP
jgi:eukaryotic-like serine/threonine-protein kinase